MRRMYTKYSIFCNKSKSRRDINQKTKGLKAHHHIRLDKEFKDDCSIWLKFLTHKNLRQVVNRPMIDSEMFVTSEDICFYSDASAAKELGYGCVYQTNWIFGQWEPGFISKYQPSIEVLELFALCAGIFTWANKIANQRIIIFCDNMGVVNMVNNNSSKCKRCMYLLRILTLNNLIYNRCISVKYIHSKDNILSDALSRLLLKRFRKFGLEMSQQPDQISEELWPFSRILDLADNY